MNLLKIWGLWPLPRPRDFSSQLSCQNIVIFYHFRLAQNEFIQKLFQKWRFLRKIEISGSIVKKQAILGHFEIGQRWARSTCKKRLDVNKQQIFTWILNGEIKDLLRGRYRQSVLQSETKISWLGFHAPIHKSILS